MKNKILDATTMLGLIAAIVINVPIGFFIFFIGISIARMVE